MSRSVTRLLTGFKPEHYQLTFDPNRETMHLTGSVVIEGQKIGRPAQRLTFHQKALKITEATIIKRDKKGEHDIPVTRINHHKSFDEVRLHTEVMLYPGSYRVEMRFEGEITRPMEGIYPCFFTHNGKEKRLIATQFESHHAREAFPCIDEPEAKATFDLTLISPKDEAVVSNTLSKMQTVKDNKLHTTFETTPRMSTYLLAFVYGEMGYKEAKTKHGVTVRTYATPDNVEFTSFALDIAVRCLDFYDDYFGIPYPLPKCDLIGLPDFASGAMENWGCITFREHVFLVDPANTSLPIKQYVVMVVAHELAHQWFGNLVTMRWWTDLWLNEGFANWMEYFAANHLFPDWHMWTQYIVDEQQPGMKLDALANTHPIQVAVKHPDEIRSIFDAISYNKGGSSLQMLASYLGPDTFRDGLRHYLKKYAYGNTDTTDLWDSLEAVSHKPVHSFMGAWTTKLGFPLVDVQVKDNQLKLTQEQFLLNPLERNNKKNVSPWPIPLNAGSNLPDIFDTMSLSCPLPTGDIDKLNGEQSGFYRVAYDPAYLKRLTPLVVKKKLSPLDRLGLLADSFEAAKAGYGDTVNVLHLLEAYNHEDDNAVWDVMVGSLSALRVVMNDEVLREALKPYARALSAQQLRRLGWAPKKNEPYFDSLLRPTILGLNAVSDEPTVVKEALSRFSAMKRSEDIPPDIRSVIYATAARKGNAATFDKLLELYHATASSEEQVTICMALTGFEQIALIERALSLITTDSVRLQDALYWVAYSFSNRHAREATWQWLLGHWRWLKDNLGRDMGFSRLPIYAASGRSDSTFLKDYTVFFDRVTEPSLERSIKQGVEIIEWQSEWRRRDLAAVKAYFKSHHPDSSLDMS
ncbi:MAG TPA: M1 family metallopeptidase [Candidatus Saccharimonadales bacterium]|nr:M1 family metallopeptidase [Candidatus Saccharimonadales bacterium]